MNEKILDGKWTELKGKVKESWGNISEDEIEKTRGNLEQLAGKINVRYGQSTDQIMDKLNTFLSDINKKI